jgi:hypothetical protein
MQEEGTRASAPARNAGSACGSSCTHHSSARFLFLATTKFCAIVCLPADRTTHACPTQTCVRGFKLTELEKLWCTHMAGAFVALAKLVRNRKRPLERVKATWPEDIVLLQEPVLSW